MPLAELIAHGAARHDRVQRLPLLRAVLPRVSGDGAAPDVRAGRPRPTWRTCATTAASVSTRASTRRRTSSASTCRGRLPRSADDRTRSTAGRARSAAHSGTTTSRPDWAWLLASSPRCWSPLWLSTRRRCLSPGASADFYAVVPHDVMVALFGGVVALRAGRVGDRGRRFWRDIGQTVRLKPDTTHERRKPDTTRDGKQAYRTAGRT